MLNREIYESGIEKLSGSKNEDGQVIARRYADGYRLIQIVQHFQGNTLAYFERKTDVLADFEKPKAAVQEVKPSARPLPTPISRPLPASATAATGASAAVAGVRPASLAAQKSPHGR